jgi:hypothetical protein
VKFKLGILASIIVCTTLAACSSVNTSNAGGGGNGTTTPAVIKFVQAASFTSQATVSNPASTYTATFSNNVTSGDLIVLAFWWNYPPGSDILSVTDSAGNSYKQALVTPPGNDDNAWIYYATEISAAARFQSP